MNAFIISFLLPFLHRAASGAKNGAGYANNFTLAWVAVLNMALLSFVLYDFAPADGQSLITAIAAAGSVLSSVAVVLSYPRYQVLPGKWNDIHFWELWTTGFFTAAALLANANIFLVICSVYPGLILHKGFVNLGGNHPFLYSGTDDPTGNTFSIPLLGWKIPRLGTTGRLILAGLSLVAIPWAIMWSITLAELLQVLLVIISAIIINWLL